MQEITDSQFPVNTTVHWENDNFKESNPSNCLRAWLIYVSHKRFVIAKFILLFVHKIFLWSIKVVCFSTTAKRRLGHLFRNVTQCTSYPQNYKFFQTLNKSQQKEERWWFCVLMAVPPKVSIEALKCFEVINNFYMQAVASCQSNENYICIAHLFQI